MATEILVFDFELFIGGRAQTTRAETLWRPKANPQSMRANKAIEQEAEHDRMFCWTFKNEDAIRMEDLKLRMKDGKVLGLFDLPDDPDEEKDLASAHLEKVKRMRELHAKWKKECEAQQTSTTDPSKK